MVQSYYCREPTGNALKEISYYSIVEKWCKGSIPENIGFNLDFRNVRCQHCFLQHPLNHVFYLYFRKKILANAASSRTSRSDRPATPYCSVNRQSFGLTPSSLTSPMTPLTSEKGQNVKTGYKFRKSITSVMSLGNNSVFEDSDCIINGVETPGGTWKPNSSETTRDTLSNRSTPTLRKFESKSDKCYSGLSFNESNIQIVDEENVDLFFSPKKPMDQNKAKTSTAIANGPSSRANTEPDDFPIDDFDIDDFDETDIPDYFEESPTSVLTSKGNSGAMTPSLREGGALKPLERKVVTTPAPQPTRPKQPGKF